MAFKEIFHSEKTPLDYSSLLIIRKSTVDGELHFSISNYDGESMCAFLNDRQARELRNCLNLEYPEEVERTC
jgi:hypothetical protein